MDDQIKAILGPVPYVLTGKTITVNGPITSQQLADLKDFVPTVVLNGALRGGFSMGRDGKIYPHNNGG